MRLALPRQPDCVGAFYGTPGWLSDWREEVWSIINRNYITLKQGQLGAKADVLYDLL